MTKKSSKKETKKQGKIPAFRLVGQYLKDLSFECVTPVFEGRGEPQDLDLSLLVKVGETDIKGKYESVVFMKGEAKTESGEILFIAEVEFAGVFHVDGMKEDQIQVLLNTEAPALLYPYTRQIFMTAIVDGGFRPPLLDPINFQALYLKNKQSGKKSAKKSR